MYSVVMMMALTAGTETPDSHRRHGCSGGYSGCAVAVSYGGCAGGRHHRGHRGHGCHGYASSCSGGYGGASYGCAGYGYGGASYGCAGYGSGGASYGCAGYGSGGASYGCAGGYVMPAHHAPYWMPGAGDSGGKKPLPPPKKGKSKDGEENETATTGTILVNLPANARLTVDGVATTSTSDSRLLVSEDLQPGYEYYYTLRAETVQDGQTVAQTHRVAVRPGEQTRVSFDFSPGGVASSR